MISRRALLVGTTALLATGCGSNGPRGRLRIAAGEPGGLYVAFTELLIGRLRARYPDLEVELQHSGGSLDNLARLRAGEAEMGLTLADAAERDRAAEPAGAPVATARVYENYLQVVVRDISPVRTLEDLQGRRISFGGPGSGAAVTARLLLKVTGLSGTVRISRLGLRDALTAASDGAVDALVWSGGVPTPAIAEADTGMPLRLLDLGDHAVAMARDSGFPYVARRVPTVGYVPTGRRSIGIPNLLLCRPGIPADVVAAVVEVLAKDASHLVPPYVRGLQYLDPPAMIQTGRVPLHDGAVRAYRRLHG